MLESRHCTINLSSQTFVRLWLGTSWRGLQRQYGQVSFSNVLFVKPLGDDMTHEAQHP